jgi:hypothetical protein
MSRTFKEGKRGRRRVRVRQEVDGVAWAIMKRHWFGSTEKIRRRNRLIWRRLANKRRRSEDRAVTGTAL